MTTVHSRTGIVGHFVLRTWNTDGTMAEERTAQNVMCSAGLTTLAQVINYFGIVDQNANMGNAFAYQDLTPIYGAVGTGTTTPTDADTQLTTEITNGRSVVYAGASTAASSGVDSQVTWSFFYGIPSQSYTIAECGVFVNATSTINSGTLLDHALISPTVNWSTSQTLTLQVTFSLGNV